MWISLAIYAQAFASAFYAWIAPLTIWIIVRYITGPYTEKLSIQKRPVDYGAYQKDVPMIIPNPFVRSKK